MKMSFDTCKQITAVVITVVVTGCAGAGYNNGLYGTNTTANAGYGLGSVNNTAPMASVEGALLNAVIQSMTGNIVNGQIGSQISPSDQTFRLQQLGGLLQSGVLNQAQQWVNPQTGNTLALNPIGQGIINPQTQQQCHHLEETVISRNGQRIQENRLACLNPQTGKWALVQ